ncbi:MAG: serine hydroxymethyltransferase [Candidatus Sungbacteria bacterium RIFCSPHIGHO2_02_FULL_47_11]|uniref:Serine hydroxymethyltransferase n=1 Tax=Candidatus Sungbacteria bacterium RIFCSPHIGHO2_02_FULL_47_11 TaxID=1802270 RepID=A0A1G2KLK7_9BACT|nr:MAG: serine hydroxymethyltransferase [Candidatus Sungbacteria bacterium RIFCSPHIGHO2_02_FULL_47_11]
MRYKSVKKEDLEVYRLLKAEEKRQKEGLEMIPSENYASASVLEALGSILNNKYSEGYPGKRYYGGNQFIDDVERIAQERAKQLFGVPHANVQPYSGSPANFAVYVATCKPGDTIMGQSLPDGGHLTHGWKASATAMFYKSVQYHVREDGRIAIDEVWKLAKEHKPKLIWSGATAYVYDYEFDKFAEIAESVGAYFAADIAHVAGLVIAGVHQNPAPHAHIVTTTTHKTLRGPRGGIIMVTGRGLKKDAELAEKVDRAVFPGLQGGPHDHQTAAIAVALREAGTREFKVYGMQIVKNAKWLAETLAGEGLKLVGGGTENHLILIDLIPFGPGRGVFVQLALDAAGITVNKNTIPRDPSSPFYPSGIRLGTPALTTRGMREKEMKAIGTMIARIVKEFSTTELPADKSLRAKTIREFAKKLPRHPMIRSVGAEVKKLASRFPVPGVDTN